MGEYLNHPVAVKIADHWSGLNAMFKIQQERNILLSPTGNDKVTFQPADVGIIAPITSVSTSLVRPVAEIIRSTRCPPYVLVTELAPRHRLYSGDSARLPLEANESLPFSVHMATWLGFIELQKKMKVNNYLLDAQADDLTIDVSHPSSGHEVNVVKLDCTPEPNNMEATVTRDIAEGMRELYSHGRFAKIATPVLDVVVKPPYTVDELGEQLISAFRKVVWESEPFVQSLMMKL